MNKFKDQSIEFRALIISLIVTIIGFLGTAVLFWFNRYDIPLAVLTSGLIVTLSWLFLYLNKKKEKPNPKLDIVFIYLRLILVVILAIVFIVLEITKYETTRNTAETVTRDKVISKTMNTIARTTMRISLK